MRTPSRRMPPAPPPPPIGWRGWAGLAAVAAVFLAPIFAAFDTHPVEGAMVLAVYAGSILWIVVTDRLQLRRRASGRPGEDLCTFARAFPRREVDTWAVRAVWDELQRYVATRSGPFPVRAGDTLADLRIFDAPAGIADVAIARADRTWDDAERNPHFGAVATVGDLVRFVSAQPRR